MEIWKPVDFAPKYHVSNLGRVKRPRVGARGHKPGVLKNSEDANGYAVVNLTIEKSRQKKVYVHHLVAKAFLCPKADGTQIAHWDGNPMNASADNLRWVNQSENEQDKKRHGRYNKVPKGSLKLSESQIEKARTYIDAGESLRSAAKRFDVSHHTLANALKYGSAI